MISGAFALEKGQKTVIYYRFCKERFKRRFVLHLSCFYSTFLWGLNVFSAKRKKQANLLFLTVISAQNKGRFCFISSDRLLHYRPKRHRVSARDRHRRRRNGQQSCGFRFCLRCFWPRLDLRLQSSALAVLLSTKILGTQWAAEGSKTA